MPFIVSFQQTPGGSEFAMIPNAGKYVQDFAIRGVRVANTIRREKRQAQALRQTHRRLIAMLFRWIEMTLQFDIDIAPPENSRQLLDCPASLFVPSSRKRTRQYSFFPARQ